MSGYLRLLDWAPGIQALSVDGNVDIARNAVLFNVAQ